MTLPLSHIRITSLAAYLVRLPLRFPIEHSLASNTHTGSLVVRLKDASGLVGYGEGVPRPYVTGETVDKAQSFIRERAGDLVLENAIDPGKALGWLMANLPEVELDTAPAAACALETALLDLAGRMMEQPISWLLGGAQREDIVYGAVLPFSGPELFESLLQQTKAMRMSEVKFKVGREDDLARLARLREVLGPAVRLRVDANACWTPEEAVDRIRAMAPYAVEAVEQPVAARDTAGLAAVKSAVEPLILADESCCTPSQARELIAAQAVDGFNLRLSKCGGPARTMALVEMARESGLKAQLGCQVGELGVLSALGRHLACARGDLIYLEGSLGKYYLQADVIREDLSFAPGGGARALTGPGLGITVMDESLEPYKLFDLSDN
jgi:L-alanine-DL-glutamate epimerase-like enolase superfamily enzyme